MKKKISVFLDAVLAGLFISIGGIVFLSVDYLANKFLGSVLFSVGLFAICTLKLNLFTGKVCYVLDNDREYALNLPIIWTGNLLGTLAAAALLSLTRVWPVIHDSASILSARKLEDSPLSIFILAFFCNILIYLAVEEYNRNEHEIGKYLGIIYGVIIFIMCNFEHCVANMFYFSAASVWSVKAFLYILVMTAGNAAGGIFIPLIRKLR